MFSAWNATGVLIGDALLGWLLPLPHIVVLLVLGLGTSALTVGVRSLLFPPPLRHSIRQDRRQLRRLIRTASRLRDSDVVSRCRRLQRRIVLLQLSYESRVLACLALPVGVFVAWGSARLEFLPPRATMPLEITVEMPISVSGQVIHLVPESGIQAATGWVQSISPHTTRGNGIASWSLRVASREAPYQLTFRWGTRTLVHPVLVGQTRYLKPIRDHAGQVRSAVRLTEFRPFGLIGRVPRPEIAPWMSGFWAIVTFGYCGLQALAKRLYSVHPETDGHSHRPDD